MNWIYLLAFGLLTLIVQLEYSRANFPAMLMGLIFVVITLVTVLRRQVFFEEKQLYFQRAFHRGYEHIDLTKVKKIKQTKWRVTFVQKNGHQSSYYLSATGRQYLKQAINS